MPKNERNLEHELLMALAYAARPGNQTIKDLLAKIEEQSDPKANDKK